MNVRMSQAMTSGLDKLDPRHNLMKQIDLKSISADCSKQSYLQTRSKLPIIMTGLLGTSSVLVHNQNVHNRNNHCHRFNPMHGLS